MKDLTETIPAMPVQATQTLRTDNKRVLTSSKAGKIVPLAVVPLLREDRVSRGQMRVRLEMMETAEMLMNAINVTVYAHFIPYLASDRFNGMDQMNRSYAGVPETEGGSVVEFLPTVTFDPTQEFWATLGAHAAPLSPVNGFPLEAYNILVNHRRKARSPKLPLRTLYDTTLAPAFWRHNGMGYIVPDFDAAKIDGEVALNVVAAQLPVKGIGQRTNSAFNETGQSVYETGGSSSVVYPTGDFIYNTAMLKEDPDNPGYPAVFAEMQADGITVSLANIELAKKTAAFAKMRARYQGLDDDHIVDLLMEGVRVPEAQLSQPILLDRKSTIVGYSRRYATDAANLEKSVTQGETFVDLVMRTPPMNTGGVILITCEVVPEQLFERQRDYYLEAQAVSEFPNFTRDFLDPEKVAIVPNSHVDVLHSTPDATFGYAPLNHQWKRAHVNVGGKYYRPADDLFDEDRQKIWSNEALDPTLTEDFYMANELHTKVFADQLSDHFEYTAIGQFDIVGNTVFGQGLEEATDDFDQLMAQVDTSRIDQTV